MEKKFVYSFGNGHSDGNAEMKTLLGGKGANLAEMTNIGLPVPPGFTISTEVCKHYYANGNTYPASLETDVKTALQQVEKLTGKKFGDEENPLLVSVRSGAQASMPGMMDTILNLGLNDNTIKGIIKKSNDERFAYDSYRRFVQMYSDVVMGMNKEILEDLIEDKKTEKNVKLDTELSANDWKELVSIFKARIFESLGKAFPEEPNEQLWGAIGAVFGSWMNQRAITYRRLNNIPADWGTAVNVQAMVFGNMGNDCATGVAFTRNPSTGENLFYGEYLVNAQGEDVVAGIRTPQPINKHQKTDDSLPSMEEVMPECYAELVKIRNLLEAHYKDIQDLEFTIEKNSLYMLQTRTGKRTASAAIKTAVDMVQEELIDKKTAVLRVQPSQLDQLLHPSLDPNAPKQVIAKGLPASPGAASGSVVFTADEAESLSKLGTKVILVRVETSPEDIHGMNAAQGILTARGGMTSHAAVVARGMGKCCIAGCGDIKIDYNAETLTTKDITLKKGDEITLNGSTGEVLLGHIPTVTPEMTGDFATLMSWADSFRKLKIRTNADTPNDAKTARNFGAEGIGLCRTEHMFFQADRIAAVREMILADELEDREKALAKILPMQKGDFIGLFREMKGLPVTIRLLDPPLHEFLPQKEADIKELSETMGVSVLQLKDKLVQLHEFNPMLGHRGCRLGITNPEIYDIQVRAIMEAACELVKNEGFSIVPEIMIPLVAVDTELKRLRANAVAICDKVMEEYGVKMEYLIGTMIELPRAALTADEVAREADFFSFGTNDLTQTVFGLSRDDAGSFLPFYVDSGLLKQDPFVSLDQSGVGRLIKTACELGRKTRSNIKLGICGEHGGDPDSITFCHNSGLDYVSCSPFRVPIARLAAAHAALNK